MVAAASPLPPCAAPREPSSNTPSTYHPDPSFVCTVRYPEHVHTGDNVGGYRLLKRLGTGGAATVWLASDEAGERVALKLLHPALAATEEARARLLRETRTVNAVLGNGVAHIVDIEVDATQPFVVSEYIPGPSLAELLTRGFVEPRGVAALAAALADTITRVHDAKIVHRDIKPSNIICSARGPVLIDFGIAMSEEDEHFTSTGLISGTAGYTAPELLRGGTASPASDWWAWHATLLSALTGRPPYGKGESRAVLMRVMEGQPDVRGLPEDLASPLLRALHPDPALRPSHDETVDALLDVTDWAPDDHWENMHWGELLSPHSSPRILADIDAISAEAEHTALLSSANDRRGEARDSATRLLPGQWGEESHLTTPRSLDEEPPTVVYAGDDDMRTTLMADYPPGEEETWEETEYIPSHTSPTPHPGGAPERTRYLPQELPPQPRETYPAGDAQPRAQFPDETAPLPFPPPAPGGYGMNGAGASSLQGMMDGRSPYGSGMSAPGASPMGGAAPAGLPPASLTPALPYTPRYPRVSHATGIALSALAAMLIPFGGAVGTGLILLGMTVLTTVGVAVRWRERRRWRAGTKRGGDTPAMLAMSPLLALRSLLALIPGLALGGALVASQWFLLVRGSWAQWGLSPDLPPLNTPAGTPEWTWPADVASASSLLLSTDRWLHYPVWVALLWAMTWILLVVCWLTPTSRGLREGVGALTSVVLEPLWARVLFVGITAVIVVGTGILIGVPWLI